MTSLGKKSVICFTILIVLGSLSSCGNSSNSAVQAVQPVPTPTATSYTVMARDAGTLQSELSAKCSDLKTTFSKVNALLVKRIGETEPIMDDPFKAKTYSSGNLYASTEFNAHDLVTKAENAIGVPVWDSNLKTGSSEKSALPADLISAWHGWCHLSGMSKTLSTNADKLNSQVSTLQFHATNLPWYPSGYHEFSDGVAWQWAPNSSVSCTYDTGSCWAINMIARDGCPNGVYSEIAILDKSGVQIDFTNATNTNVPPMQKVRLTFDTFNQAADTARLSKITC